MVTYEQWNKAIISYFFENCEPGEIVFLQTNAETLDEIAELSAFNVPDAANSLKMAVRHKVVRSDAVNLRAVKPIVWKDYSKEDSPQVAFLALTVFAASKMETLNYYEPLNDLFFDDPDRGRWKQGDLENIEKFWKHLQNWVEYQHDIKLHLTKGPPNQRFVWYSKSQCLISKYDEHKLHALFQETELKPGVYLAEKQLLDILCSSRYFENLSVKITRPIREKKIAETRLILGQIQLLLENWDGEVIERVSRGIKRQKPNRIDVQLRFNIFDDIDEMRYWLRCKRGAKTTFKCNTLGIKTLQPLDDVWFKPCVIQANSLAFQVLKNGVELKSEETKPSTFRLKPSEIWIFRHDSEPDDGWFSKGNLLLYEDHIIVYRKRLERDLISFLHQICNEKPIPKSIYIADQETGWQYIKIKPTALCDSSILGLRVTTSNQIRFVGGLPFDKRSNSYFDFHLPTIVVPNLIDLPGKSFYINGQVTEIPGDRKIELSGRPNTNKYQFLYLDCQETLRIISPIRSTNHEKQTLVINIDSDSKDLPIFMDRQIAEISDESGVWLTGAKFFGINIPQVSWKDVEKIPKPPPSDPFFKTPANIISSVIKVAIDFKRENTSVPEWFDEALEYLDQNVALRALVEKKLNHYYETALSYVELRKQIGK